ncbi:MAG: alpha/beta fold hydrolase [Bacteroidales bacterium]
MIWFLPIILYVIICIVIYVFQEKIIFRGKRYRKDFPYHYDNKFKEIFLKTPDGAELNALIFYQETNSKGLIFYLHGNRGHLARSGNFFNYVKQYEYDVFMYDYRGYGKSTGEMSYEAICNDTLLMFDYAKEIYRNAPIVVFGNSIGSSLAAYIASQRNVERLILESPFYNLKSLLSIRYFYLPIALLLKYPFPTNKFLEQVHCPVFIIHGDADKMAPLSGAIKLKEQCKGSIIVLQGVGHDGKKEFSIYHEALREVLK